MMNGKMRHIHFFAGLLLPALLAVLSGCTERTLDTRPDPVPIRLYTDIRTRAAIDAFDDTPVCIACGMASGAYTTGWDAVATAGEIILTPVRYYPEDGSRLYLRGYYPPVPMSADGTLIYNLTGAEDLLLSDEQDGSLATPFTAANNRKLTYSHLLTKLNFIIRLEGNDVSSLRVRFLQLNGLADRVVLTLHTGRLSYDEAAAAIVVYSASADSEGLPFTEGMLQLPGYALVQPKSDFTLDMVISIDDDRSHDFIYNDLPVSFEGGTGEGGVAYTVKVELPAPTFPDPLPVKVTATIVPWETGDSGSGNIPGWE